MQTSYITFIFLIAEAGNKPNNFLKNQNIVFMKKFIQLLHLLIPARASGRRHAGHKNEIKELPLHSTFSYHVSSEQNWKNKKITVIMVLFISVLFLGTVDTTVQ